MCRMGHASDSDSPSEEEEEAADEGELESRALMKNSAMKKVCGGADEINYREFLKGFHFDDTALTQKVWTSIFNENKGDTVEVEEFMQILDRYRRMSYDGRMQWCFKVYDLDDSGSIDKKEFVTVIVDTNFNSRSSKQAKGMISKLSKAYESKYKRKMDAVTAVEFKELAKTHGSLLVYPAMGVLEHIMAAAFLNPDDHIDPLDFARPGQGGALLRQRKETRAKELR